MCVESVFENLRDVLATVTERKFASVAVHVVTEHFANRRKIHC